MRPLAIPACSVLAAALLAGLSPAQQDREPAPQISAADTGKTRAARQASLFQNLVVPGRDAYPRIKDMVKRLDWTANLGTAVQRAQAQDKPILWIQALGDLKGYT